MHIILMTILVMIDFVLHPSQLLKLRVSLGVLDSRVDSNLCVKPDNSKTLYKQELSEDLRGLYFNNGKKYRYSQMPNEMRSTATSG